MNKIESTYSTSIQSIRMYFILAIEELNLKNSQVRTNFRVTFKDSNNQ